MSEFEHLRHKPPTELSTGRDLVLACPPLKSNVNLSRIVRAATCCGVKKLVACGNPKIDPKIARDGLDELELVFKRSLPPVLKQLKQEGFRLVGLEQTTNSKNIHSYEFDRKTVLVIGHERNGIEPDVLQLLDDVVEIPVYGKPHSFNVATATAMLLYEFCRQFPEG